MEKTELEKMLAGEWYYSLDEDLMAMRFATKRKTLQFNQAEDIEERLDILKEMLGRFGENSYIEPPFLCNYGEHIFLDDFSYINYNCVVLDNNHVHIGKHTMLGPAVQLYTAVHPLDAETRNKLQETAEPITIGDNVWIGGAAVILPGITIGNNAVVGAGAVVTKNVEPFTVVAGNPAKVIKSLP